MIKRFLLTLTLLIPLSSSGIEECPNLLGKLSPTTNFLSYLERLIETGVIGDRELLKITERLENPISETDTLVNSSLLVHRQELERYLSLQSIRPSEVAEWARSKLKEKERIGVVRDQTRSDTKYLWRPMEFNVVEGGQMRFKSALTQVRKFELMSTLVTQSHWVTVLEKNPSHMNCGPDSVLTSFGTMKPDHPVENVAYMDALAFIEGLKQLSVQDDSRLHNMIVGHRKGDRYRLPTEVEWLYVATNRGRSSEKYFFGDDLSELKDYAWYLANSQSMTHQVGLLKPLIIDGAKFYDILGNVWEWVLLQSFTDPKAYGGSAVCEIIDPIDPKSPSLRPGTATGFRLVRVREEK